VHLNRISNIARVGFTCAALLYANEGTKPKRTPAEYPAHAETAGLAIGADYMVRTVSADGRSAFLKHYLAVEVALYPAPLKNAMAAASHFSLRVNGSRGAIFAQAPNIVGASIKYPDWEHQPQVTAEAGPIIIGRQPSTPRFPGDNRERYPRDNSRAEEGADWVAEVALREGPTAQPVSGYLYFPYKGNPEKIRSLELIYDPGAPLTALRVRLR
jgi:hypothetical protein